MSPPRPFQPTSWTVGGATLSNAEHTLVMGIVNVTPDSFSDGGELRDPDDAVAAGWAQWEAGADLIDIGGESTRPGAQPVTADEELARVLPVVASLAGCGALVSIDTSKAVVAEGALAVGAAVVNDVTALGDPAMADVVREHGAGLVLMHMRGEPRTMQDDPVYEDVVTEVAQFLAERAEGALAAGIPRERICLDPGIGFGKTLAHNLALLTSGVSAIAVGGSPVLVGASRKSFLQKILGPIPVGERDEPTVAAHVLAIAYGAAAIRVHNVVAGLRTARVADAIVRAS